jgi:hypothetical protein
MGRLFAVFAIPLGVAVVAHSLINFWVKTVHAALLHKVQPSCFIHNLS